MWAGEEGEKGKRESHDVEYILIFHPIVFFIILDQSITIWNHNITALPTAAIHLKTKIEEHQPDIVGLTGIGISTKKSIKFESFTPYGYSVHTIQSTSDKRGCVLLIKNDTFSSYRLIYNDKQFADNVGIIKVVLLDGTGQGYLVTLVYVPYTRSPYVFNYLASDNDLNKKLARKLGLINIVMGDFNVRFLHNPTPDNYIISNKVRQTNK